MAKKPETIDYEKYPYLKRVARARGGNYKLIQNVDGSTIEEWAVRLEAAVMSLTATLDLFEQQNEKFVACIGVDKLEESTTNVERSAGTLADCIQAFAVQQKMSKRPGKRKR